ncbi:MAG TPA: hypothetical protein VGU03_03375 [Frateuria sp.]|uniref:hypothetical protein n=1 Tax=Frateuria sp. TaxID=2211372 RepID=UPI002DEDF7B7|nr:hypothetical protein [Frateuria sp.]
MRILTLNEQGLVAGGRMMQPNMINVPGEGGYSGGGYYAGSGGGGAYAAAGGTPSFVSGIESWFGGIVSSVEGWVGAQVTEFENLVGAALGFGTASPSGLTEAQASQACAQVNAVANAPLISSDDTSPQTKSVGVICNQGVMSHIANMDASPIAICRNDGGTWNYKGRFCATK